MEKRNKFTKTLMLWDKRHFSSSSFPGIEKVLTETFERVAYNLDIIYAELKNINYLFPTKFEYGKLSK